MRPFSLSWGLNKTKRCGNFLISLRDTFLFFYLSLSPLQNELGVLEFIHALVETLDKYFENVCELDIMFNIEKAHYILGEFASAIGRSCSCQKRRTCPT